MCSPSMKHVFAAHCALLGEVGVLVAEEVVFVPGGALWVLGDVVAAEEGEAGELCGGIEIEIGLAHVVLWRGGGGRPPPHGDVPRFLAAVGRLESRRWHNGRNALLDEGILVAADEDDLFRHRVRAFNDAYTLGGALDDGFERSVFGAEGDDVGEKKKKENLIDVDVGDDGMLRDGRIVGEIFGTEFAGFFASDGDEEDGAT